MLSGAGSSQPGPGRKSKGQQPTPSLSSKMGKMKPGEKSRLKQEKRQVRLIIGSAAYRGHPPYMGDGD